MLVEPRAEKSRGVDRRGTTDCRPCFFAVRRPLSLPCAAIFAVRRLFAGRKNFLRRATAHGKEAMHGRRRREAVEEAHGPCVSFERL